jgi:hypothetical protein
MQLVNDINYIYRVTSGLFIMNLKGIDKSHFSELFINVCNSYAI